jgi:hypothetical protein
VLNGVVLAFVELGQDEDVRKEAEEQLKELRGQ